jgi:hypothetical protein
MLLPIKSVILKRIYLLYEKKKLFLRKAAFMSQYRLKNNFFFFNFENMNMEKKKIYNVICLSVCK